MEINKKICISCKQPIADEREYICEKCYNEAKEQVKDNELYNALKGDKDLTIMALAMVMSIFNNKGENK
jgi:reverse gyrase